MTWSTTPPPLPAPGWYPDPEYPNTWRWWDGTTWADVRQPMAAPPASDPYALSTWFEQSTEAVKAAVRQLWLVVLVSFGVCFVSIWFVLHRAADSADGREVRDLLQFDERFGSSSPVELTSAESDRLGELLGDLARTWGPWLVLIALVTMVVAMWAVALAAHTAETATGPDDATTNAEASLGERSRRAIARVPAVFGSGLLVGVIVIGAMLLPFLPTVLAVVVDGPAVAIGLSAVFGAIASIALTCWLMGRLALAPTIAALGRHGVGVSRSWELTRGRYWGTIGRLLIASLIASVVAAPLNLLVNFGVSFSLTLLIAVVVVSQAISSAASVLITTPATVVLIRHLTEQYEPPTPAR